MVGFGFCPGFYRWQTSPERASALPKVTERGCTNARISTTSPFLTEGSFSLLQWAFPSQLGATRKGRHMTVISFSSNQSHLFRFFPAKRETVGTAPRLAVGWELNTQTRAAAKSRPGESSCWSLGFEKETFPNAAEIGDLTQPRAARFRRDNAHNPREGRPRGRVSRSPGGPCCLAAFRLY